MASRNENESPCISTSTSTENSTVCPICFEDFKSPRYLPCLHNFCSDCLLSYIVTACKQKEAPVGFQCPLCKIFVPAPVFPAMPEKWVELIPVNKTIQALVAKGDDINFCDACKRDNEEEIASNWCRTCSETLCDNCAKCHRKNLVSSKHIVIPLTDLKENIYAVNKSETLEQCSMHQKKLEYVCDDHQETCCMHCVCTEHRTCTQVDTIEKHAKDLLESQKINKLIKKLYKYTETLEKIKMDVTNNIKEIDNASDDLIKQSTGLKTELMTHIDFLFEKHIDDISRVTKESRRKLTESVECFSDRQLLADTYIQTLENIQEVELPDALVVAYNKIKKHSFKVAASEMSQIEFHMKQDVRQELREILKLSTFANLTLSKQSERVHLALDQFSLLFICELEKSDGTITGGCFLSNGDVLLVDTFKTKLFYCNNVGKFIRFFPTDFYPDDLTLECQNSRLFYITCSGKSSCGIHSSTLSSDKSKLVNNSHFKSDQASVYYGLTCNSGFLYVACGKCILKMDTYGNVISHFKTEEKTYSVAVNRSNHIISSSCSSHSVTSMNETGEVLFLYTHATLKWPHGLDVDYEGYIYVCGRESNNIHILSPSGDLLQIIEASRPNCIKFKKDSRVCFIGSYRTCNTKVCEFTMSWR